MRFLHNEIYSLYGEHTISRLFKQTLEWRSSMARCQHSHTRKTRQRVVNRSVYMYIKTAGKQYMGNYLQYVVWIGKNGQNSIIQKYQRQCLSWLKGRHKFHAFLRPVTYFDLVSVEHLKCFRKTTPFRKLQTPQALNIIVSADGWKRMDSQMIFPTEFNEEWTKRLLLSHLNLLSKQKALSVLYRGENALTFLILYFSTIYLTGQCICTNFTCRTIYSCNFTLV